MGFEEVDLIRFFALLFWPNLIKISIKLSKEVLERMGFVIQSMEKFQTMFAHLSAYAPTINAGGGNRSWMAQRDETQIVGDFECIALSKSKLLFYLYIYQFITIGDELMGPRYDSNPVKSISMHKADRKCQSADFMTDVILYLQYSGDCIDVVNLKLILFTIYYAVLKDLVENCLIEQLL